MRKTRIFAIVNQKGGVGKTTTAVNLATALAACGKKVLLIDADPQGNASTGLGIGRHERKKTIYEVIGGECEVSEAIIETVIPNLKVITSTVDLAGAELELVTAVGREYVFKESLATLDGQFDFVIIDCPPSLGLLTVNALVAADSIIVPLQCEFYALEGLSHLLKTVELIKKRLNPKLEIHGVVLTMYDKRNRLSTMIEEDVRKFLGDKVYGTVIPRNVRVSEAPSHGKPAIVYDLNCSGSKAYVYLASEIIKRERIERRVAA